MHTERRGGEGCGEGGERAGTGAVITMLLSLPGVPSLEPCSGCMASVWWREINDQSHRDHVSTGRSAPWPSPPTPQIAFSKLCRIPACRRFLVNQNSVGDDGRLSAKWWQISALLCFLCKDHYMNSSNQQYHVEIAVYMKNKQNTSTRYGTICVELQKWYWVKLLHHHSEGSSCVPPWHRTLCLTAVSG